MEDFWRLIIREKYSVVRQPAIAANNFEFKSSLITMVQPHKFTRHPSEDPNEHLCRFLRMANTMKMNGGQSRCYQATIVPIFTEGHSNQLF